MPGDAWNPEDFPAWAEQIRDFIGLERPSAALSTVLATVLFTDIVGSTRRSSQMGDREWKDLLQRHHAIVRDSLHRFNGTEVDTAGDGFYATFDGPARAIEGALALLSGAARLLERVALRGVVGDGDRLVLVHFRGLLQGVGFGDRSRPIGQPLTLLLCGFYGHIVVRHAVTVSRSRGLFALASLNGR